MESAMMMMMIRLWWSLKLRIVYLSQPALQVLVLDKADQSSLDEAEQALKDSAPKHPIQTCQPWQMLLDCQTGC